jgi:hypothetical protein
MAENGKLPPEQLSPIAQGQLKNDCAAGWNAMNVESRKRGLEIVPTGSKSSYRTYEQQQELYQMYLDGTGNLAAVPGTSNHGWGTAVDVATEEMRSMIDQIGAGFGWSKSWSDAPSEWWHICYQAGHYSGPDPGPAGKPEVEAGDLVASAVAANGNLHVFVADGRDLKVKWQAKGKTDWSNLAPLDAAPDEIVGVAAETSAGGNLHVFVRCRNGKTYYAYQRANESAWSALSYFAG